MLDQLNELLDSVINDERFLVSTATMLKKFYDELVAVGFTEGQATKIVVNYKMIGT